MSFTQTLRQISSECNFLVFGSSPVPETNKPNQILLQALNKGHVPQREKTLNSERIFLTVLRVYLHFSTSSIFQKHYRLDCNTDELIFTSIFLIFTPIPATSK